MEGVNNVTRLFKTVPRTNCRQPGKMQCSFIPSIFLYLALFALGLTQEDPQEGCRSLEHCLTSVDKLWTQCKNSTNRTGSSSQGTNSCIPGVKKKLAKLNAMEAEKRRQYRDCILGRMKLAVPITTKEKQTECEKTLAAYRDVFKNSDRASAENQYKSKEALESQLYDSDDTDLARTIRTKRLAELCERKAIEEQLKRCNEMTACCSEATFCELEYQLTSLHDEIALQQMLTFIEMRRCAQEGKRT